MWKVKTEATQKREQFRNTIEVLSVEKKVSFGDCPETQWNIQARRLDQIQRPLLASKIDHWSLFFADSCNLSRSSREILAGKDIAPFF